MSIFFMDVAPQMDQFVRVRCGGVNNGAGTYIYVYIYFH
jgi:hypothetical protein